MRELEVFLCISQDGGKAEMPRGARQNYLYLRAEVGADFERLPRCVSHDGRVHGGLASEQRVLPHR